MDASFDIRSRCGVRLLYLPTRSTMRTHGPERAASLLALYILIFSLYVIPVTASEVILGY